jgi:hypothetical protein
MDTGSYTGDNLLFCFFHLEVGGSMFPRNADIHLQCYMVYVYRPTAPQYDFNCASINEYKQTSLGLGRPDAFVTPRKDE